LKLNMLRPIKRQENVTPFINEGSGLKLLWFVGMNPDLRGLRF